MKVERGSIVLLTFPFSDASGSKVRPALVVQTDDFNQKLDNTIVAMITTSTERAAHDPTQYLIDLTTPTGKQSGLLFTSAVTCLNLLTVSQRLVRRTIGSLPTTAMAEIEQRLKAALGLS